METTSDLVLVRASQLTCRKGWDQDFWEPNVRKSSPIERLPRGAHIGPVPPATAEDIDAIVKAGRASDEERAAATAAVEEDRVVGAAPSPLTHVPKSLITKHLPLMPEPDLAGSSPDGEPNSREKILIAKEEVVRKRINNRLRMTVEALPSAAVSTPPPVPADPQPERPIEKDVPAPPEILENSVGPVADDNMTPEDSVVVQEPKERPPLPFEVLTNNREWDDEPLVPPFPPVFRRGSDPEDRHSPHLWLLPGGNGTRPESEIEPPGSSQPPVADDDHVVALNNTVEEEPFELPPPVETPFTPPGAPQRERPRARKQRRTSSFRSRWADARERPRVQENHPAPMWHETTEWTEVPIAAGDFESESNMVETDVELPASPVVTVDSGSRSEVLPSVSREGEFFGLEAVSGADWSLPELVASDTDAPRLHAYEDALVPSGAWAVNTESDGWEQDDVVVSGNMAGPIQYDPEIDEYVLAPNVPRMCRTCAAFRPAEDGERGWCSNGWAFNNRLLVSAQEVPCETSFGNWWIPNDAHWDDGVVERLHAPAPLFDQLMAQKLPLRRERSNARKRWS